MLAAVLASLPVAVGFVLAALPMVIVSVILVTKRPPRVGRAFLGGWLFGLATVGVVVIAFEDLLAFGEAPPAWLPYVKVALGTLLIVLGARKLLKRPRPDEAAELPAWLSAVDTLSAGRAFGLAVALAAVNPKHLALLATGATAIVDSTPLPTQQLAALLVFVLVASLGVAAPVAVELAGGENAGPLLAATDQWLTRNSAPIIAAVLLALGAVVLLNGVRAL